MIDLLLLGNGAMMPLPDRWLSALLVRFRSELILFDCGEGTQISWRDWGWGFRKLGTILLTHLHADHVAGLPGLLHTVAHAGRVDPLLIAGPEGTRRAVTGLMQIAVDLPFSVEIRELSAGDTVEIAGGMQISTLAAQHSMPCLGYRGAVQRQLRFLVEQAEALGVPVDRWHELQQGKSVSWGDRTVLPGEVLGPEREGVVFGFVTDTRPPADAARFFQGVDLLVSEGTFGPDSDLPKARERMHMTFSEAATIARDAGAKALWLTHFSPAMTDPDDYLPAATSIFPATTIGFAGLQTTLAFSGDKVD